jgi:DNA-binding MarR family transcriptional regulator
MRPLEEIMLKLNQFVLIRNENRFRILAAIYNHNIYHNTKGQLEIKDLQKITELKDKDLKYHLNLLVVGEMVTINKRKKTCDITKMGEELLHNVGITEKVIGEGIKKIEEEDKNGKKVRL